MKKENVRCNMCGKSLQNANGVQEDFLRVKKEWNYFSGLDQSRFEFCLCEECFCSLIRKFQIPARRCRRTELL